MNTQLLPQRQPRAVDRLREEMTAIMQDARLHADEAQNADVSLRIQAYQRAHTAVAS